MPSSPQLIGLVGGIASGKSAVAAEFARLGGRVVDADVIAHEALELPEVRRALAAAFGDVETAGKIDRKKIAAKAFAGPAEVKRLNEIVHPQVKKKIDRIVEEAAREGFRGPLVVDAALLLEAGMRPRLDAVVFVEAPEAERRRRALSRGWTDGELARREGLQMPLAEKKRQSDAVIDNGGSREEMAKQVKELLEKLKKG